MFEKLDFTFVASIPAASVATPSTSPKRVLAELAKVQFEKGLLPPGTRVTVARDKVTVANFQGRPVSFRTKLAELALPKPTPKAVAVVREPRPEPSASKLCKDCGKPFTPARRYFQSCPCCHLAKANPPAPAPVTKKAFALDMRDLKSQFDRLAKTGFEAGTLPEAIKVTVLGSQVTVAGFGFSTTFHSDRLRKQIEERRVAQERAARAARALAEAAERQARADKAAASEAPAKPKKGKDGGKKNKKAERAAHAQA